MSLENLYSLFALYVTFCPGIIDAGIGEAQVNTFLSALDIHPVSKNLLKRHERDAGLAIERLAKKSCQRSIQVERKLTIATEMSNFTTSDSSHNDQLVDLKYVYICCI